MCNARIEISYEEYDFLKNKVKDLENKICHLKNDIDCLNSQIVYLHDWIDEIINSGFFERLMKWNKIIKNVK